jgi:hypothetical protein
MAETYYWVYIPEVDEAGTVIHAKSFDDAFEKACEVLYPDAGVEVQIHELGRSQSYSVLGECDFCARIAVMEDDYRNKRCDVHRETDHTGNDGCAVCPGQCVESDKDEVRRERDRLLDLLQSKGGRDIELADEIDSLNCVLGECVIPGCCDDDEEDDE